MKRKCEIMRFKQVMNVRVFEGQDAIMIHNKPLFLYADKIENNIFDVYFDEKIYRSLPLTIAVSAISDKINECLNEGYDVRFVQDVLCKSSIYIIKSTHKIMI